ncbi:SanA protein [Fulvivirga sp. RKSG066]|uniref:SanA/YdcF family protein n=1 Tax=Fulvivirga aurantia TaxID=2529383 RepID=UPI0012BD3690|nr:ElyC/SanA/YdcF family protein [Fulvivirga aurantia]MTI22717.1 SanA protein [Fulvivirga aurantia]
MGLFGWFLKATATVAIAGLVFVLVSNLWIYMSTRDAVYDSIEEAPQTDIALVLGTSPKLMTGEPNPFFHERIKIAAKLLKMGKVKHIIVSGDNQTKYYNEPIKMYNALLELGVPKDKIDLDYAGLRTLDSIVRCKEIFGQDNITIITQPFHSYRALFISDYYDIKAISLSETNIPSDFSYKVKAREYLARALAVLDLYLFHREPKYLGKKETISI